MSDPFEPDTDYCLQALQSEIFGHLSLRQVQILRSVSTSWQSACQGHKRLHLDRLNACHTRVLLLELQSAKGKLLNGKIVKVEGPMNIKLKRYPVGLTNWLSGKTENLTMKPCNLHPFFNALDQVEEEASEALLIDYTQNSKLRRSHGMMLDQLLMLARWESNCINGMIFEGTYDSFIRLPRNNNVIARLNSTLFTWWTTPPSLAGIRFPGTICDVVSRAIMDDHEGFSKTLAQEAPLWDDDGPQGKYMVRNFLQFLRSWEHERVAGSFWVVRVYPSGTIVVHIKDDEDPSMLGQVYLVKGHNSVIGELFPSLPGYCRATLLPIYDCWTYDGIVSGGGCSPAMMGRSFQQKLNQHVENAIHSKTVSWRGPSAAQEFWKKTPPFPTIALETDSEIVLNWQEEGAENINPNINTSGEVKFTKEHLQMGRRLVKLTTKRGGVDSHERTYLIFRRFGYSYKDNPNGICSVLYNRNGEAVPSDMFNFEMPSDQSIIPTYKLGDVLQALIQALKTNRHVKLPRCIQPDELSVVRPLRILLDRCFKEVEQEAPDIHWYPPPSAEESAFATTYGHLQT